MLIGSGPQLKKYQFGRYWKACISINSKKIFKWFDKTRNQERESQINETYIFISLALRVWALHQFVYNVVDVNKILKSK